LEGFLDTVGACLNYRSESRPCAFEAYVKVKNNAVAQQLLKQLMMQEDELQALRKNEK